MKKVSWTNQLNQNCTLHSNGRLTISGITRISKATHVETIPGMGAVLFGKNKSEFERLPQAVVSKVEAFFR